MTKTARRRARKLIFPLVALALMIAAMGLDASKRQAHRPPLAIQAK